MIRPATLTDAHALAGLENSSFDSDRISPRQFRYLLTRGRVSLLVDERENELCGYVLVFYRTGTSLARLYSLAVSSGHQGQGTGRALVMAAEQAARDRDCAAMRLEVRRDNPTSLALFASLGYRQFGHYPNYYQDHMEALRFEKKLLQFLSHSSGEIHTP
ncbi:MAG: N-acetyltransferase [Pseudomonadota bacterium]